MDFLTVSQTWCRFNCTISLRNFYANTRKVTSISDYAFSNCSSLASHEIPNNVESIGSHAFESSSKIKSIVISWKVTSIKEYAFYKCANLVSISIPEKVTLIVNYSFFFCSNLASIKIPKSVSSIVQFAFCNCSIFTTISIPSKVTRNWRNLSSIQILIDLYYINCFAFNLILAQSFSIRKKVTQISEYFFDTFFFSLKSIQITENVDYIDQKSFF